MSSPGGGKVTRTVQSWTKYYHTPVPTMDTNKILRGTITEETHTKKGDTKTWRFVDWSTFWGWSTTGRTWGLRTVRNRCSSAKHIQNTLNAHHRSWRRSRRGTHMPNRKTERWPRDEDSDQRHGRYTGFRDGVERALLSLLFWQGRYDDHLRFTQTEVIHSIPDTRPRAHLRIKDTVRICDPEECGDKVFVEAWNDGKGHASQEGVQGFNQRWTLFRVVTQVVQTDP